MIYIDFAGGAHGNYLEFVCNKIAGVVTPGTLPFNNLGASHDKSYCLPKIFLGVGEYNTYPRPAKVISIQIHPDDLLPLTQISLLRVEDFGYDNDQLEIDTFNKLNNKHYRQMLDQLIEGFFADKIRLGYNAVKDPSWPTVTSMDDFNRLPEHIKEECLQQHGLVLLELSEDRPNCPRSVLREFFQIGFQDIDQQGFIAQQNKATYRVDDVYIFPFGHFYHKTEFLNEIKKISAWAGMIYDCENEIAFIHDEFLKRQPYKDSKLKCDDIVSRLRRNEPLGIEKITLLEEAYINAALGWDYFQGD